MSSLTDQERNDKEHIVCLLQSMVTGEIGEPGENVPLLVGEVNARDSAPVPIRHLLAVVVHVWAHLRMQMPAAYLHVQVSREDWVMCK